MKQRSLLVALSVALLGLSGCVAYPIGHPEHRGDQGYQRDGDRDHDRDGYRDQRDRRDDRHDDSNCDPRVSDCRRH